MGPYADNTVENCEEKNRKLCLSPSFFTNIKDSKQLSNYVEEAVESESLDSSTDNDNTVFVEFIPK